MRPLTPWLVGLVLSLVVLGGLASAGPAPEAPVSAPELVARG